jgi:hypothetical protein
VAAVPGDVSPTPQIIIIIRQGEWDLWSLQLAWETGERHKKCFIMGKPEGNRQLRRSGRRWEDNTKMDIRVIGWNCKDWTNLALEISSAEIFRTR